MCRVRQHIRVYRHVNYRDRRDMIVCPLTHVVYRREDAGERRGIITGRASSVFFYEKTLPDRGSACVSVVQLRETIASKESLASKWEHLYSSTRPKAEK